MVPKSNVEYFLQAIIEDSDTPFEAKSRIERYLTDILEERVSTLEPVFRIEYYLAKISGADVELPEPISRADLYLAALAGEEVTLPDTPNSSLEEYLARWCETGNAVLTITGNPVRFTGMTNTQIQALSVNLRPIQDLHGYSNPWPAGGGKNKFDPSVYSAYLQSSGKYRAKASQINSIRIPIPSALLNTACTFSFYADMTNVGYLTNVIAQAVVGGENKNGNLVQNGSIGRSTVTFTPTSESDYIHITFGSNGNNEFTFYDIQLEASGSVTDFAPYSNICPISGLTGLSVYVSPTQDPDDATVYNVEWSTQAGTVYGGMVDVVTGVLTVDMVNIPSYNGETINEPWLSSMDAYASGTTPTIGAQVVYTLATPVTYQLTPQEVESLLGVNNIWSDSGDVTVVLKNAETYEEVANG